MQANYIVLLLSSIFLLTYLSGKGKSCLFQNSRKNETGVDSIALTEEHVFSGMRPEKLAMNN
jgi:hypothetical protein